MEYTDEQIIANELTQSNDWEAISKQKLDIDFIYKYKHKLNLYHLLDNNKLPFELMLDMIRPELVFNTEMVIQKLLVRNQFTCEQLELLTPYCSMPLWGTLCTNQQLTTEFIDKYFDYIDFESLYKIKYYDNKLIDKYSSEYSYNAWAYISQGKLEEWFIHKHCKKIVWDEYLEFHNNNDNIMLALEYKHLFNDVAWIIISRDVNLSEETLIENASHINFNYYLDTHLLNNKILENLLPKILGTTSWDHIAISQDLEDWFIKKYSKYMLYRDLKTNNMINIDKFDRSIFRDANRCN